MLRLLLRGISTLRLRLHAAFLRTALLTAFVSLLRLTVPAIIFFLHVYAFIWNVGTLLQCYALRRFLTSQDIVLVGRYATRHVERGPLPCFVCDVRVCLSFYGADTVIRLSRTAHVALPFLDTFGTFFSCTLDVSHVSFQRCAFCDFHSVAAAFTVTSPVDGHCRLLHFPCIFTAFAFDRISRFPRLHLFYHFPKSAGSMGLQSLRAFHHQVFVYRAFAAALMLHSFHLTCARVAASRGTAVVACRYSFCLLHSYVSVACILCTAVAAPAAFLFHLRCVCRTTHVALGSRLRSCTRFHRFSAHFIPTRHGWYAFYAPTCTFVTRHDVTFLYGGTVYYIFSSRVAFTYCTHLCTIHTFDVFGYTLHFSVRACATRDTHVCSLHPTISGRYRTGPWIVLRRLLLYHLPHNPHRLRRCTPLLGWDPGCSTRRSSPFVFCCADSKTIFGSVERLLRLMVPRILPRYFVRTFLSPRGLPLVAAPRALLLRRISHAFYHSTGSHGPSHYLLTHLGLPVHCKKGYVCPTTLPLYRLLFTPLSLTSWIRGTRLCRGIFAISLLS